MHSAQRRGEGSDAVAPTQVQQKFIHACRYEVNGVLQAFPQLDEFLNLYEASVLVRERQVIRALKEGTIYE